MKRNNLLHKFLIFCLSFLFSGLIYFFGIYLSRNGYSVESLTDILIVILCAVFTISFLFSFNTKNISAPKLSLKTVFALSYFYYAILFLTFAVTLFLCGLSYQLMPAVHFLFSLFAAYMIYRFIYAATIRLEAVTDCVELDQNEYVKLFEIARNAASAIGINEKIRIFVQMGFPLSATSIDGEMRIIIGTHIPALLTEYELEAMLTAEMGLIKYNSLSVDTDLKKKYTHWQLAFNSETDIFPNFFLIFPFRLIESKILAMLEKAEDCDEKLKNNAVIRFGIPTDYLNGIAKLTRYHIFLKLPPAFSLYENPAPPRDFQERLLTEYNKMVLRSDGTLKNLILNTEEGGFGTPLRKKLDFFGLKEVILDSASINQSYISEGENLLKLGNDLFADSIGGEYDKMRNIEYLLPKETTDKYESDIQTGILLEESDLLKIGIAYITISEYQSAEKIFDEILFRNPDNANACFEKGKLLLSQFNESGIAMVLKAPEQNRYITPRAYMALISYFRLIGDTENADKYCLKYRLIETKEEAYRSELLNIRSANDFSPVELSLSTLSDIKAYLRTLCSENIMENVILTCRKLSNQESVNIILVKMLSGISSELKDKIFYEIFFYLDNRNENFYLISYEQYPHLYHIARTSKNSVFLFRNSDNHK